MGLFKNFKESMDDAGALTERAAQSPGGLEAAQAAAQQPVDLNDPVWAPIDGITLDKYAQLTAAMARQDLGTAGPGPGLARIPGGEARHLGPGPDGLGEPHGHQRGGAHPLRHPLRAGLTARPSWGPDP